MKKQGISLLVLIITIVVIIILATAIIVNLANTNIIGNANEAVLKQDIANLQSELEVYISDKFIDEKGKYDRIKLNADATTATYGTENIEDKNKDGASNIYDIVGSLKKSKYKDVVYINEGNLVFKKSGLTDEEVRIVLEMGLEVDGMPKLTNITTEATYTSIKVTLNVTLAEEVKEYIYILNDGENEQREESTELIKEYTGLTPGINYGLKVIVVLKDGTEIPKEMVISTKNIDGELTYKLNEEEWTTEKWTTTDVEITIEYSEETMPEGYELQYRMVNANLEETDEGYVIQDWTSYTAPVVVTTNNTLVMGRIYNENLNEGDAKLENSTNISNIDRDAPTKPTELTFSVTHEKITAQAGGSEDSVSGIAKYMYSIDNVTWQDSNEFTDLEELREYTIYVKAIDNVGNESEVLEGKAKTSEIMIVVFDNTNGGANTTINGEEFSYNNPVVPVGFKAVTTAVASWSDEDNDGIIDGWNDGLVIQDANKNEFVWVPVDGTNVEYKKWCTTYISYGSCSDDTTAIPVEDETAQITKYKGFYVGRYETTVPDNQTTITGETSASNTTGIPTVKRDAKIWTHHSYLSVRENAKTLKNDNFAKSGLITGKQYDTLLTWIHNEKDSAGNAIHSVSDGRSWGNVVDATSPANVTGVGTKQVAGYSKYWRSKNIYDIAGNAYEWTAEFYSNGTAIARGAACIQSGYTYNPTRRTNGIPDLNSTHELGASRLALFVQ